MPAFAAILSIAALAGSLVNAAPIPSPDKPATYYEPYDTHHSRYLALDCEDQQNTTATEIASASSYIASTAEYGVPTGTAATWTSASSTATSKASKSAAPTHNDIAEPASATSTSAAANSTPAAPSGGATSGVQTGGFATFFYQNGNPGACGTVHADSDAVIAIDQTWYGNSGETSQYCGKYITLTNTNNGKSVTAMVADDCPSCDTNNSLDLSTGAFSQIADLSDGEVPITWYFSG